MEYEVVVERKALKSLRGIARRDRDRILDRIDTLAEHPRPQGAIQLQGVDAYRYRVGNYRIIYTIDDEVRVVAVVEVGHRREIYRRLR